MRRGVFPLKIMKVIVFSGNAEMRLILYSMTRPQANVFPFQLDNYVAFGFLLCVSEGTFIILLNVFWSDSHTHAATCVCTSILMWIFTDMMIHS